MYCVFIVLSPEQFLPVPYIPHTPASPTYGSHQQRTRSHLFPDVCKSGHHHIHPSLHQIICWPAGNHRTADHYNNYLLTTPLTLRITQGIINRPYRHHDQGHHQSYTQFPSAGYPMRHLCHHHIPHHIHPRHHILQCHVSS